MYLSSYGDDTERCEIEEALGHLSREAGRVLAFDNLGRPSERHARLHAVMNGMLDLWEMAR